MFEVQPNPVFFEHVFPSMLAKFGTRIRHVPIDFTHTHIAISQTLHLFGTRPWVQGPEYEVEEDRGDNYDDMPNFDEAEADML
jgi:hypothetical protein